MVMEMEKAEVVNAFFASLYLQKAFRNPRTKRPVGRPELSQICLGTGVTD